MSETFMRLRNSVTQNPFEYAVAGLFVIGTLARIPLFLVPAWAENPVFHPWRQAHNLMMIREIMRGGVDFGSTLPLFGPPWVLPFEFPVYQNFAAAVGWGLGLGEESASRLTTLFFFQASGLLILLLSLRIGGGRVAALIALSLWEFTSLLWSWSATPTIEFLAVFLVMWAVLVSLKSMARPWSIPSWALETGLWSLAFLVKITTVVVWAPFVLSVVWFFWNSMRQSRFSWLRVISPVAVGGLIGLCNVLYGDAVKASGRFTEFLTLGNYRTHNFGTLDQRLDLESWAQVINYANGISGFFVAFVIFCVLFILFEKRRESLLVGGGLASICFAVGVFFNLYVIHNYYWIAVAPIVVMMFGLMGHQLVRRMSPRAKRVNTQKLLGVAALSVILLSWLLTNPRASLGKFIYQEWRYGQSEEIAMGTLPNDGVAVVGCSWSPEVLYFADRRGLMLHDTWPTGNMNYKIPDEWVGRDISFVYLCNASYEISPLFEGAVEVRQVSTNLYEVALNTTS